MSNSTPITNEMRDASVRVADALKEKGMWARGKVLEIIKIRGIEFVEQALADALEIDAGEGMMTADGDRRRTIGGVFFRLVKDRVTNEERAELFPSQYQQKKNRIQKRLGNNLPVFDWSKRVELFQPFLEKPLEELKAVRVRIIGRPKQITFYDTVVVALMQHTAYDGSVPAGMPPYPEDPTVYTIYISQRHWIDIARQLKKSDRMLDIEGLCVYDPELKGMAIYSLNVSFRNQRKNDKISSSQFVTIDKTTNANDDNADEKEADSEKPKASKKEKKPKKKPEAKAAPRPVTISPVPLEVIIPDGIAGEEKKRLEGLYAASAQYRDKLKVIMSKPEDERFGLSMTQKLLSNVESQIQAIIAQYS